MQMRPSVLAASPAYGPVSGLRFKSSPLPKDPFDRLLVAQALVENLVIATKNPDHLWLSVPECSRVKTWLALLIVCPPATSRISCENHQPSHENTEPIRGNHQAMHESQDYYR
jgi:hypothetical protein